MNTDVRRAVFTIVRLLPFRSFFSLSRALSLSTRAPGLRLHPARPSVSVFPSVALALSPSPSPSLSLSLLSLLYISVCVSVSVVCVPFERAMTNIGPNNQKGIYTHEE